MKKLNIYKASCRITVALHWQSIKDHWWISKVLHFCNWKKNSKIKLKSHMSKKGEGKEDRPQERLLADDGLIQRKFRRLLRSKWVDFFL